MKLPAAKEHFDSPLLVYKLLLAVLVSLCALVIFNVVSVFMIFDVFSSCLLGRDVFIQIP